MLAWVITAEVRAAQFDAVVSMATADVKVFEVAVQGRAD